MNIPRETKKIPQRKLFSVEEDRMLRLLVMQYGARDFKKIATFMPGRTARQVRERYRNYLAPEINNGPWSRQEDDLLRAKFAELGPKWSKISSFFPTRSDVSVKNRWTSICGRPAPPPVPVPVPFAVPPPPPPPPVRAAPVQAPAPTVMMVPYESDESLPGLFDDGDIFHMDPFASGYISTNDWVQW